VYVIEKLRGELYIINSTCDVVISLVFCVNC